MAINREEVQVRIGVDSSAVSAGMAKVSFQVNKFVQDTGKKLLSLAKANIWLAAADLLQQALPTAEEFWNRVYGVDEATTKKFQDSLSRLKTLRAELEQSKSQLAKAEFGERAPKEQRAMLLEKKQNTDAELKKLVAQRDEMTAQIESLKSASKSQGPDRPVGKTLGQIEKFAGSGIGKLLGIKVTDVRKEQEFKATEARGKIVEERAKIEARINKLTADRIGLNKQIAEVDKKVPDSDREAWAKAQVLKNRERVATLRQQVGEGLRTGDAKKIRGSLDEIETISEENRKLFDFIPGYSGSYNKTKDTESDRLAAKIAEQTLKVEIVKVQGE